MCNEVVVIGGLWVPYTTLVLRDVDEYQKM